MSIYVNGNTKKIYANGNIKSVYIGNQLIWNSNTAVVGDYIHILATGHINTNYGASPYSLSLKCQDYKGSTLSIMDDGKTLKNNGTGEITVNIKGTYKASCAGGEGTGMRTLDFCGVRLYFKVNNDNSSGEFDYSATIEAGGERTMSGYNEWHDNGGVDWNNNFIVTVTEVK